MFKIVGGNELKPYHLSRIPQMDASFFTRRSVIYSIIQ